MVTKFILEKYKQREREIGIKIGLKQGLQQVRENPLECMAWYERKQAALREGRPFTEPPPGYSPKGDDNGSEAGLEAGIKQGREERQREWESWYERQQAAFREGRPFDEPTPGHSPDAPNLSK